MTSLEALQPTESGLGRSGLAAKGLENPLGPVLGAVLGQTAPENGSKNNRFGTPALSKRAERGVNAWAGYPGFGRTIPPKPTRLPRGSFPPTRYEGIQQDYRTKGEL